MSTTNPPDVGEQSTGKSPLGRMPSGSVNAWIGKLVLLGNHRCFGPVGGPEGLRRQLVARGRLPHDRARHRERHVLPQRRAAAEVHVARTRVPRGLPAVPGGYTFYASFTNLGTGHLISQEEARASILVQNEKPVADALSFDVRPIVKGNEVSMLITDPETGTALIGTSEGTTPAPDAEFTGATATAVPGYDTLNLGQLTGDPNWISSGATWRCRGMWSRGLQPAAVKPHSR